MLPHAPPDLRLKRLIDLLADADRRESICTWKRSKCVIDLLTGIGCREIALTHDSFDALPQSKGVEFLREMLVHHGNLPERDRHLATFERWLNARLESLSSVPTVECPIGQFGRWHHLKRLRTMSETGKNLSAVTRSAKQEITEAGKFVTWLREQHQIALPDCRQANIEDYLSSGPTTRHAVRTFIFWHLKAGTASKLTVPHRYSERKPLITQARRLELIDRCINANGAAPPTQPPQCFMLGPWESHGPRLLLLLRLG